MLFSTSHKPKDRPENLESGDLTVGSSKDLLLAAATHQSILPKFDQSSKKGERIPTITSARKCFS